MAALASSLIRQRREVKDPQANRQIASKRKPCPKSNKSLCQKQILILISKVRLCGSRGRKMEKRPEDWDPQRSSGAGTQDGAIWTPMSETSERDTRGGSNSLR
ncbi:Fibroblast growth factor 11 [Xenoophorus captivus]|uniref:Fibroblast growth factor 11 n=1 Tax=Xenoophorus captivus TaxID=1517983 RepID=A0ABV0QQE1_9TELE